MSPKDHPAAELPARRYRIVEVLANGKMAVVYRAADLLLGREVVVKVLQERYADEQETVRRFTEEAQITCQLQHPNIPPVHDIGTLPNGRPFFTMKLVKGRTLQDVLDTEPNVAAERGRLMAVFEQVCLAMAYAHARGVVHCDLKLGNVMIGAFGEVLVIDWGLARVLSAQATDPGGDIDFRTDVFGLGAILAAILTGKSSSDSACIAQLDACGADPDLVALCKSCLSPEKVNRLLDSSAVFKDVVRLRAAAEDRARQAWLERALAEEQRKRKW